MWLMTASYQEGRELADVFIYKFKKLSPVDELLDCLIASMLESYGVSEPKIASIKVNGIDGYVGEGYATTCRRTAKDGYYPLRSALRYILQPECDQRPNWDLKPSG